MADKIDFATFKTTEASASGSSISFTAPADGRIKVTYVKTYYNDSGTPGAGSASINDISGKTKTFNVAQSGGNLGSAIYATTLVAMAGWKVNSGETLNISASGSSAAGIISHNILVEFSPA